MTTPQQSSPPAPQAVKELVERSIAKLEAIQRASPWLVQNDKALHLPIIALKDDRDHQVTWQELFALAQVAASLQEDRDRIIDAQNKEKARADQAERAWDELIKMLDAARGNADSNYARLQQAERDLAAERERGKELERAIGMQDVRLMVGEGRLSAQDVLAGVNAVIRHRAALSRPASTEPSLGESK